MMVSAFDNVGLLARFGWSLVYPSFSYMILFVTARCNARCKTCFYWRRAEENNDTAELTAEQYKRVARSSRWLLYLSVTGGEPFLRTDLAEIIHHFYLHSRIRFLNISTNCLLHDSVVSQTEQMLKENPRLKVKITLSIDDVQDRHDAIRGVPGNFEKCIRLHDSLVLLRERLRNLTLEVGTTFSSFNQETVTELIDFVADRLQVDDHTFTFVRGDARDAAALQADLQRYKDAVAYLERRRRGGGAHGLSGLFGAVAQVMYDVVHRTLREDRMVVPCVAGWKLITLDERGIVRPCEILWQEYGTRFDIADLRENQYDLAAIRSGSACGRVRQFIRDTRCHCSFECANLCNIVYSAKMYPAVLRRVLKR